MRTLVSLTPERALELCNLQTVCGMERWPRYGWEATLASPSYAGWGLELVVEGQDEGPLDAIALGSVLSHRPHTARLDLLMTRPSSRRQGLATTLLGRWHAWALNFGGVTDLLLEVEAGNQVAIGMYAKMGFVALPQREGSHQPLQMGRPVISVGNHP